MEKSRSASRPFKGHIRTGPMMCWMLLLLLPQRTCNSCKPLQSRWICICWVTEVPLVYKKNKWPKCTRHSGHVANSWTPQDLHEDRLKKVEEKKQVNYPSFITYNILYHNILYHIYIYIIYTLFITLSLLNVHRPVAACSWCPGVHNACAPPAPSRCAAGWCRRPPPSPPRSRPRSRCRWWCVPGRRNPTGAWEISWEKVKGDWMDILWYIG